MTAKTTFQSVVPPTLAEAAAAGATWERRGPLGRLVRIASELVPAEQVRRPARSRRPAVAPASRSF